MPASPPAGGAGAKPKPKGKGGARIAGIPVWAWAAAIGVGLVVGFVFLRRKNAPQPDAETVEREAAQDEAGGGATVVEPLSHDLLTGLGLRPPNPTTGGQGSGGGDSYDGGGGGDGYYLGPGAGGQSTGDYVNPSTVWPGGGSSGGGSSNPAPIIGTSIIGGQQTQTATVPGKGRIVE